MKAVRHKLKDCWDISRYSSLPAPPPHSHHKSQPAEILSRQFPFHPRAQLVIFPLANHLHAQKKLPHLPHHPQHHLHKTFMGHRPTRQKNRVRLLRSSRILPKQPPRNLRRFLEPATTRLAQPQAEHRRNPQVTPLKMSAVNRHHSRAFRQQCQQFPHTFRNKALSSFVQRFTQQPDQPLKNGQQDALMQKLEEIRRAKQHLFPGTIGRYFIEGATANDQYRFC